MVNVTLTPRNLDHPLDKIFGGIPAGSTDFTRFNNALISLFFHVDEVFKFR
jgi:hypothetical protein